MTGVVLNGKDEGDDEAHHLLIQKAFESFY